MTITLVAGTRPNFIKIAPLIAAIQQAKENNFNINYRLIHTGQHYDTALSEQFFSDLNIPTPHINFNTGSGTHAHQTAHIMIKFEEELNTHKTDLVIVVGDVNSTLACSIVAKKACVPLAHVEAGIRSFDMSMPEEINRIVTDALADYFFVTTTIAKDNLLKYGVDENKIFFVGNTMIDTLLQFAHIVSKPDMWDIHKLTEKKYIVLTLHRPANVDNIDVLEQLMTHINQATGSYQIIFPVHPRTKNNLSKIALRTNRFITTDPLKYPEFIYLIKHAFAVITDSGGIQEETTVLGVPCFTLRDNTERPETILEGTNQLIGTNPRNIKPAIDALINGNIKQGAIPKLWDGQAASRIIKHIITIYNLQN